ncbi:TonB-dependent receptor [Phocaeicola dorei]|nr:TonB-dependent receptor [Phocaeicola dorei]
MTSILINYITYMVLGSIYETGGTSASVSGSTLFNEDVRSELISSWEAGAEVRFFNNRLGLDVAWYKSNAKRQLLNLPMNSLSGFSSMKIKCW